MNSGYYNDGKERYFQLPAKADVPEFELKMLKRNQSNINND